MRLARLAKNPVRLGLGVCLVTLFLVLVVAGSTSAFNGLSPSALGATLRDGSILLGIFWIVVGFLLGSSVNAYVGTGSAYASVAPPMIWPKALPERSPEVLENLKNKLSEPQGVSILFVVLGIVLMLVGFVAYASAIVGLLAMATLAAAVVVLLAVTGSPSRVHVPP